MLYAHLIGAGGMGMVVRVALQAEDDAVGQQPVAVPRVLHCRLFIPASSGCSSYNACQNHADLHGLAYLDTCWLSALCLHLLSSAVPPRTATRCLSLSLVTENLLLQEPLHAHCV